MDGGGIILKSFFLLFLYFIHFNLFLIKKILQNTYYKHRD